MTHLSIRLFMKQRAVYIWVCPVTFAVFPANLGFINIQDDKWGREGKCVTQAKYCGAAAAITL